MNGPAQIKWRKFMDYFRKIENDVIRYGKKGDCTLEYIGINIKQLSFDEYKCYRFVKNDLLDLKIENNDILKPLDFQKNNIDNIYRISYKVNLNVCHEKLVDILKKYIEQCTPMACSGTDIVYTITDINNYIKNLLQTEIEPICAVGIIGQYLGFIDRLKIYYQMKIYEKNSLKSTTADTEKYFQIIEFMSKIGKIGKEQENIIKKFFDRALYNDFDPMMIGIDINRNIQKIKYYFQTKEKFSKEHIQYKFSNLVNSRMVDEIVRKMDSLGLKMKGFTIPYTEKNIYSIMNIYFCEV